MENHAHNHGRTDQTGSAQAHHHDNGGMKGRIILIALTAVLLAAAVLIEKKCALETWQLLLVYLVPYLLIGRETLKEAAEGIIKGDMFNEDFLMSIATIGALCIGFLPGAETQFPEAGVRDAVLPGRRAVRELCRGQEPRKHLTPDGHKAGHCECRTRGPAGDRISGGGEAR